MINFGVEIDTPNNEGVIQKFIYSAQELGHNVIQTEGDAVKALENVSNEDPFIFFGCLNNIRKLQEIKKFQPLVWCDWDLLSCQTYYKHYKKYLLQQEYGFYTFGEIPTIKDSLYEKYGYKNKIFIRPNTNDKVFCGEVVGEPQFDYWLSMAKLYEPKPETLCVVSKPTNISFEYRFIIVNGKVITGSLYKVVDMIQYDSKYDKELVTFAEEVAAVWQPHPIFVMDIVVTKDKELKLIEIGSINGAGLYKCDIKPIVKSMVEITQGSI